jgi:hypothetical protein
MVVHELANHGSIVFGMCFVGVGVFDVYFLGRR